MRPRDRQGVGVGRAQGIERPALMVLLDAILDAISVPVIAAGGIATARGVAAALAAGASAVRVGTRLIAADESDGHPVWKRAIVDARPEDAVVSAAFNARMPAPGPHRVLRRSVDAAEAFEAEQVGVVRLAGGEIPVARFAPPPPTRESRRCRSMPASPPAPYVRSSPPRRPSPSSRWAPGEHGRSGRSAGSGGDSRTLSGTFRRREGFH